MESEIPLLTEVDGKRLMEIANSMARERLHTAGCVCQYTPDQLHDIRVLYPDTPPGDDLTEYSCPTCKVTAYHTSREVCEIHVSEMFNIPVDSIPRKHPEQ